MAKPTKPINPATKKVRVVLDMRTSVVQRLDDIQKMTEEESRSSVIRKALKFYAWAVSESAAGNNIYVGKIDGDTPPELTKVKIFIG